MIGYSDEQFAKDEKGKPMDEVVTEELARLPKPPTEEEQIMAALKV